MKKSVLGILAAMIMLGATGCGKEQQVEQAADPFEEVGIASMEDVVDGVTLVGGSRCEYDADCYITDYFGDTAGEKKPHYVALYHMGTENYEEALIKAEEYTEYLTKQGFEYIEAEDISFRSGYSNGTSWIVMSKVGKSEATEGQYEMIIEFN